MSAPSATRPRLRRWQIVAAAVATMIVAGSCSLVGAPSHTGPSSPRLEPCETSPVPCYGQDPLHHIYGMGDLYRPGITGAGTTIAVIAPYLYPWLTSDLDTYSHWFRLPAPRLKMIRFGHAPSASPGNRVVAAWAREVTADLEVAHFMAPGARLIYLGIPPGGDDEATAMTALSWLVTHTQVDVVSFSWGIYEPRIRQAPHWRHHLAILRGGLIAAARAHVTIVAGGGDSGPTIPTAGGHLARYRAVAWPTSDPLVTAVGSAVLHPRPDGTRLRPDTVDGDDGRGHATGADLSALYPRPPWQDRVASVTGSRRGVVDISMAQSAWVYTHFNNPDHSHPEWGGLGGTSVSAPLFAGLVADAVQLAGRPLGVLGPTLCALHGSRDGVLDITEGTNSLGGVHGFAARPGYDLPSGIGTVGAAWPFVKALARIGQPAAFVAGIHYGRPEQPDA